MKSSDVESAPERVRVLNAVVLQNAVLWAQCDVVSDSPRHTGLACGSRSLFNIASRCGGNLPRNRAALIPSDTLEVRREVVLNFPTQHMRRVKAIG
jgi:hypothetical protein